jgi:20S proteasome alpha/beta subunit
VAVKCEDGILIASDSRTVYGRGVPISRDTNKIHILEKEGLVKRKVALVGAGAAAFIDKFIRGFLGADLVKIARDDLGKEELSLSEALSKVAEPLSKALYEEYVEERKINDYTYDLIIAGFEDAERVDAFTLYGRGLAEPVDDFTAIGSGAAYAELFLRYFLPSERRLESTIKPVCYVIRLVGMMDPFVGGKLNLASVTPRSIEDISQRAIEPPEPMVREALRRAMEGLRGLLEEPR